MHPVKYIWALRAAINKPLFKSIGNMTYIGKTCFVTGKKRISIGNRTRIFPGIRMEAIGIGEIVIGNNCAIEQNVHIISSGTTVKIGNDVTISGNVFISNTDHEYSDIKKSVMDQELLVKDTIIGDGSFIGYGAVILPGTNLGKHCVIGANSVVKGVFPDNCVIVGSPAYIVKKYNSRTKKWESMNVQ